MASTQHAGEIGVLVDHVPLRDLLVAFMKVSTRAWGGGSSTVYMMDEELVRRGWITHGQFALDFGLSRLVPGINLLSMAVMVGYRLNGPLGSVVSIFGLMFPASVITILLTAGFAEITSNAFGASLVRGAVPVTAALTFAFAFQTGREIIPWRERRVMTLMLLYVVGCFAAVAIYHVNVVWPILCGAAGGAFLFRPSPPHPGKDR
ncbi:MAG: chromate transporter [Chloroflexota bacterium]|jgi:chromate transporter|nr:chromate transporter [Chloroflexota bacterium]